MGSLCHLFDSHLQKLEKWKVQVRSFNSGPRFMLEVQKFGFHKRPKIYNLLATFLSPKLPLGPWNSDPQKWPKQSLSRLAPFAWPQKMAAWREPKCLRWNSEAPTSDLTRSPLLSDQPRCFQKYLQGAAQINLGAKHEHKINIAAWQGLVKEVEDDHACNRITKTLTKLPCLECTNQLLPPDWQKPFPFWKYNNGKSAHITS